MRNLSLLLVSLAACGGSSKSSGLGNIAGAGGPPGPPPTIAWTGDAPTDGGSFEVQGFPAVSDDGMHVLLAWQMGDGGRGYPNLRLVTIDRADKAIDTRVVLDQDKVDDGATVDAAAQNQFLAESNARERWRPLAAAPVEKAEDGEDYFSRSQSATLGDWTVRFDDSAHLVIAQGGKAVVDTVESKWLVEDHPMYEGAAEDEVCSNPIFLDEVYLDGARRVAVIGVAYYGNDSCWEPSGEYHVVTW